MGWQRTGSLILVAAAVSVAATSAYWISAYDLLPQLVRGSSAPMPVAAEPALPPPILAPGARLFVPVQGVTPDQLADTYSQARDEGARRHDAIDIPAPAGTPVRAAMAGTLEKLFTSGQGGLTLYIRSPDQRVETYYAHLNSYAPGLAEGQSIAAGQRLGTVGSTGNADAAAPHLHFAVARKRLTDGFSGGEPVNPYPLLTGSSAR